MATLALVIYLVAFVFVSVATESEETTTVNYRQDRQSDFDPNIFGVASVAGVTSRNGRVSTTGGIHFFPAPDAAITTNGDGYYNPLTFSKAINGKYATGSVQFHPGALGVSSSAQSGYNPGYNTWPENQWNQWPIEDQWLSNQRPVDKQWPLQNNQWQGNQWPVQNNPWPIQNEFLAPFERRDGPWFSKFKYEIPQTRNFNRWMYPTFNPFLNLWR